MAASGRGWPRHNRDREVQRRDEQLRGLNPVALRPASVGQVQQISSVIQSQTVAEYSQNLLTFAYGEIIVRLLFSSQISCEF